ncbi:hypothetical protein AD998_10375 [bacterium 336/3]|nr:hypothetical protein AD998_10375 [bacterium 336/3]
MKVLIVFVCTVLFLTNCKNNTSPSQTKKTKRLEDSVSLSKDSYTWIKVLDSAVWRKSYNFQMFGIRDTLWVFHPQGNWFSLNGKEWQKSPLSNSINNLAFLDYVYFKDAVYGLGYFNGNIENFTFKPEIYKTSDFKNWETISTNSNLPKRFFYHPFVFNNKLWLIGGEDKNTQYADIWSSEDGIEWTKQKDNLPFGKRSNSQIVFLNGKLYLLDNDVWSSTDALNWQKETDEIVKGEKIFGYTALVFDGKIWLLGCNRNGQFSSQVLVSSDGRTWRGENAPWSPRGGIAATVYQNKIYMTGGKYGGTPEHTEFIYSNDVWVLSKND